MAKTYIQGMRRNDNKQRLQYKGCLLSKLQRMTRRVRMVKRDIAQYKVQQTLGRMHYNVYQMRTSIQLVALHCENVEPERSYSLATNKKLQESYRNLRTGPNLSISGVATHLN
mmetsp:Transcript_3517/g.4416  ORF Transcript_3517/g.4416 Transcript_3517/m.4416 type:complete len:113 (-) Transcript_3517:620-958(-)